MMDKQTAADDRNGKFADLGSRVAQAKELLSPANWWKNPWVKVGVGVAIGFAIGRIGRGGAKAQNHESILHGIVRASLAAAAAMLVRQALETDPS